MYYLKTDTHRFVTYPLVSPLVHLTPATDTSYTAICGQFYSSMLSSPQSRALCTACRNIGVRDRIIREGKRPFALLLHPITHRNRWTVEMSDHNPIDEVGYIAAQRATGPFYSRDDALYYILNRLYDEDIQPTEIPHRRIEDVLAILAERYRIPVPEIYTRPGGLQVKLSPGAHIGEPQRIVADILNAARAIGYGVGSVQILGNLFAMVLPYGPGWLLERSI